MAFRFEFLHVATADKSCAEVFRLRVFDGICHRDGFVRTVEDERADERFEFGYIVGGCHVYDNGVLFSREIRLEDDAFRGSACPLQFSCDDWHAMAEGIQWAECVAFFSKCLA